MYIKDHVTKLTSEPTDKATTLKLFEHLNTGRSGSCVGKIGYCVEVTEDKIKNAILQMYKGIRARIGLRISKRAVL